MKFSNLNTSFLPVVLIFVYTVLLGFVVGGTALHDPDTCWLLSMGKWIFQHACLPPSDPFSYTQVLTGNKPVFYQWLSELIFYSLVKFGGTASLPVLAAVIIALAFIAWAVRWLWTTNMRRWLLWAVVMLSALAASVHFLARPEIFSFLLLTVLMDLSWSACRCESTCWRYISITAALMVLWCNLHSGFVLGIVYLVILLLGALGQKYLLQNNAIKIRPLLWMILLGLIASLFNPWSVGLWHYLPKLFFSPINSQIAELQPLSWKALGEWAYYPFFLLSAGVAGQAVFSKNKTGAYLSGVLIAVVAVLSGIMCLRLIPFAVLFLLAALRYLTLPANADRVSKVNELESSFNPQKSRWPISIALLAAFGAGLTVALLGEPQIPQGGVAFNPPFKAIEYLQRHQPAGRLLNDPQYGDVLIWNLPQPPLVFIDTRYDMYGERLLQDYQQMVHGSEQGSKLMQHYDIAWVFLPRDLKLSQMLLKSPDWLTLYDDGQAVILARKPISTQTE